VATRFLVEFELRGGGGGARQVEGELRSLEARAGSTASAVRGLGAAFAALGGIAAVVALIRRAVQEATAADESMRRLNQAIATSGRNAGVSADEIEDFASRIQRVSRISDDAARDAATSLLRFSNVQGDIFRRALQLSADVASQNKRNITETATAIGRALELPGKGQRALMEAGVVLSEGQVALLSRLADTGHAVEAQSRLLAVLEQRYRGAAEAAGQGYAGALDQARNAASDLLELLGGAGAGRAGLIGTLEELLRSFAEIARDEGVVSAVRLIARGLVGLIHVVGLVADAFRVIPLFFAAASSKVLELITRLVAGAAGLLAGFVDRVLDRVRDVLPGKLKALVPDAETLLGVDKLRGQAERQAKITQFFADRVVGAISGITGHAKALWALFQEGEGRTLALGRAGKEAAKDLGEFDKAVVKLLADAARMSASLAAEIAYRRQLIALRLSTPYSELENALAAAARAHEVEQFRLEQFAHFADLGAVAATRIANALADQKREALEAAAAEESLGRAMESLRGFHPDVLDFTVSRHPRGLSPADEEERLAELDRAREASLVRTQELLRSLRTPAEEFAVESQKIEELIREWPFAAEKLRALIVAMKAEMKWGPLVETLSHGLSGLSAPVEALARGLADVVEGLVRATTVSGEFGRGLAMAAQGAFAIAQALGLLDRNRTAGGFGGRGAGNYTSEGSAIGAVIGGIIGGIVGAGAFSVAGAAAGSAIGSAVGGIVGAFIKKGAQEALGSLKLESGDIVAAVTKNEGSLGRVITELGQRINEALQGLLDVLGAEIIGIPKISVKVRDGIISVWVGAVNARVKEMDDAIAFAVTEVLKQADISGLSQTMRTILQNTKALSIDQLGKDLEFGQWYERWGLRDVATGILDAVAKFRTDMRRAAELGLDQGPVVANFVAQLKNARDQLLGIQIDPAEQLRRDIAAWNQQVDLLDAEEKMRRADLLFKKAELEAKIAIARAEIDVALAGLGARREIVRGEAALVGAEVGILGGLLQALQAADEALAIIDGIIEALKGMKISDAETEEALKRLAHRGGGGALDRGSEREAIDREIARFDLSDIGVQLADAQAWFDDMAERIRAAFKGAEAARRLTEAEEELARRRDEITAAQRLASQDFIVRGTVYGGALLTGLRDIGTESQRLQQNNRDLAKSGAMTTREMRELNRQIREAAENQRLGLIADAQGSLLLDLYTYLGEDDKVAKLKYDLALAEFQIRREELAIALKAFGLDMTVLGEIDELIGRIRAAGPPKADGGTTEGPPPGQWYTDKMERDAKAAEEWGERFRDAMATLVSFERRGIDPFLSDILEIQEAFADLRRVLGDTERVQSAYARAIADTIRQFLEPAREALAGLSLSEFSPLEAGERLMEAERQLRNAQLAFRSGDLAQMADAARQTPDLVQQLLREAQAALPEGSQAFKSMFKWANEVLGEIVAWGNQFTGDTTPGTPSLGPGPLGLVNFDPVVTQLQMGQDATTLELIAIRQSSERTANATDSIDSRLAAGLRIAGGTG
jgi:hypothetical protein